MHTKTGRRGFLKTVALTSAATATEASAQAPAAAAANQTAPPQTTEETIAYPRRFTGRKLATIAFPLGGVGAGAISLGGRGQLRDWEIFNRSEKGKSPAYALPAIWAQVGSAPPIARVLESRILPPFEGHDGLGVQNAPGLARLASATFTGEFPLARIDFHDPKLPVAVRLEAFSPFIPLEPEDSGLPAAILRYRVRNPGRQPARVSIAFAIDNPVTFEPPAPNTPAASRANLFRESATLAGLYMHNPGLESAAPRHGSFALCVLDPSGARVTHLTGWPKARWWTSPLLFWDDFSSDGELGPETGARDAVASLCLRREIAPGADAEFAFLLAWHFPNRTPTRMGWSSGRADANALIGNYYAQRFPDAWAAAEYTAAKLPALEKRMRQFLSVMRDSNLPAAVKEAAMANLSTLASTTTFRTADGRFFGWEGSGCCHGNCDHVWNYECTTHYLFPSFARSMRETHLEVADRLNGAMPIRVNLPLGSQTGGTAAADGQMGQIVKAYLDWQLSGDNEWLRRWWPALKKAIEFAWIKGGWDADRDGVFEGVQHNTYDVEFYGPNPMCGIHYLGALRAAEEMARAADDSASAGEYRKLYDQGRQWIDSNLFNGEYYVQQIRGVPRDQIPAALIASAGAEDSTHPDYQVGDGCLADQLVGQHVAQYAGLPSLLSEDHIRKTLRSIYKYNFRRSLADHDSVERTYALNGESGLLVCDYGKGKRPLVPFPYFSEVWTGFEYQAAALMMAYGMVNEGIEIVESARRRYDGEKRNPWDEIECGPHYVRAMSAWATILALSGFRYNGPDKQLTVKPHTATSVTKSFWSTGTGWGSFTLAPARLSLSVLFGKLSLDLVELPVTRTPAAVRVAGRAVPHTPERGRVRLRDTLDLAEGQELTIQL